MIYFFKKAVDSDSKIEYFHILRDPDIIPRMKVDWNLPGTLSREQIEKLIDTARNIRKKAIITLVYSSGLRAGEVARLVPSDIHMSRMKVHVRNSNIGNITIQSVFERYNVLHVSLANCKSKCILRTVFHTFHTQNTLRSILTLS